MSEQISYMSLVLTRLLGRGMSAILLILAIFLLQWSLNYYTPLVYKPMDDFISKRSFSKDISNSSWGYSNKFRTTRKKFWWICFNNPWFYCPSKFEHKRGAAYVQVVLWISISVIFSHDYVKQKVKISKRYPKHFMI